MDSLTIAKHPKLEPSEDYAWLRQRGLEYIQQLGSRLWTDYNIHDPGVTLLELLCYALTDLGYRTSHSVADLLAPPPGKGTPKDFERQGFHTAREILTVNPLTIRDFRKLLIDIDGIKNGWLQVKTAACESLSLYADCQKNVLSYSPPAKEPKHPVSVQGLYDVLVEFEDADRMGNLNSGKVFYNFAFDSGSLAEGKRSTALIELRLPSWQELEKSPGKYGRLKDGALVAVKVAFISGNKGDNRDVHPDDRATALRKPLFVTTLSVSLGASSSAPAETLEFTDVPMRVWFRGDAARKALDLADLKRALEDASASGLLAKYRALVREADRVMRQTRSALHAHRNVCEDYCSITAVAVEDIAICADVELDPSADIESVMAEAFYRIDQYLSPDIKFHSLAQLMDRGIPVEEIFEGPKLANGFIDHVQVDSTNLRTVLYTSDIINLLMDIPGVIGVRNFSLAKYDVEGKQVAGGAWELSVTAQHQPRFYPEASKFLIFKNGLPFLPDTAELNDVLQVIKGRNSQPKFPDSEQDLPIERGTYYRLEDYFPIQYQLPLTYGVGYEGLPSTASVERIAQAKQLKGYLLFFEQMLVNYLAQLANVSECFAIDAQVQKTYFSRFIGDDLIRGIRDEIYPEFDGASLQALAEVPGEYEYLDRRNRFLDHMLARFAESFSDYAVMLYRHSADKEEAKAKLIEKKVAFLRDVPRMTHDRAKAFDYTAEAAISNPASVNAAGLSLRIQRLLGLEPDEDERVFVVEHLLLRPRVKSDPLLPICIPPGCEACGGEDPYSFRLTVIICGEGGLENSRIDWRRFAENAVRMEVPAHLAAKICWVSKVQLGAFEHVWCKWLEKLRKGGPKHPDSSKALTELLGVFNALKTVYPPASLHDCIDGNDENRVFLNQSVITSFPKK